jgi:hypothetical protein
MMEKTTTTLNMHIMPTDDRQARQDHSANDDR